MQNRADKKLVVFLNETWANSHDGKDLAWVPVTEGEWHTHQVKGPGWLFLGQVGFPIQLSSSTPKKYL